MKLHECRKPRDHFPYAETQGQRNVQGSTQLAGTPRGVIGLLQRRQYRLYSRQVVCARLRQLQAPGGARHQGRTHVALELRGDPRYGWLGQAQLSPGAGEASRACNPREKPEGEETIAHTGTEYILVAAGVYPLESE